MRKSHSNPVYYSNNEVVPAAAKRGAAHPRRCWRGRTFSTCSVVKKVSNPSGFFVFSVPVSCSRNPVCCNQFLQPPLVSGEQLFHHSSSSMSRCGCVQSKRKLAARRRVTLFKQTEERRKWKVGINIKIFATGIVKPLNKLIIKK